MEPFKRVLIALLCCLATVLPMRAATSQTMMSDDDVKKILRDRIDVMHASVGIVIGVIDENGPRVVSYGKPERDSAVPVDGDTVFEIGSITKVFTATLLADMAARGEVGLNDPISKYLPASVKTPKRNGQEITLLHLATHTSELPRLPDNFAPADPYNPYVDDSVERMYAFLSSYSLPRDVGATFEYSNFGFGLLGHILALRAGTDYETLVRERITKPLGMSSTSIALSPVLKARLAQGYGPSLFPTKNWDFPALPGAGALRSTANDMLKFVAANLDSSAAPLSAAMQEAHVPRHEAGSARMSVGLAWHIVKAPDREFVWHNGGTGGYQSFMGLDVQHHRGIVVLSNAANSVDDIGLHWLDSRVPVAGPDKK
ncbi:MAG: ampH [Rhodocyclales bacterium]|nr:ampH [Rhodocyclales bacterium]